MFKYTLDNKRYHTLNYFLRTKFNSKVFKVSLDLGLSCPNIDGTKGVGGCIYCKGGSVANLENKNKPLKDQFDAVKETLHKKWPQAKYIAYFQNNTNTYAPVSFLREKCEEVLQFPNVLGIHIATRCDAISDECLDYLIELNKKTDLVIELGLQTIHEKTSKLIHRGHDLTCFTEMVKKLREKNIEVVVHIINGLPNETKQDMLETVKYLNQLDIQGIKIHMLHILSDTKLAKMYSEHPFPVLTREEYVDIVCDQLELLRPEIVIHRITGDPKVEDLIAPTWLIKKFGVLNEIDKEMVKRDSYQGKRIKEKD